MIACCDRVQGLFSAGERCFVCPQGRVRKFHLDADPSSLFSMIHLAPCFSASRFAATESESVACVGCLIQ